MVKKKSIKFSRSQKMAKKKQPFHIKNNMKQFELKDGTKFWAKDEEDAKLYRKHVGEK